MKSVFVIITKLIASKTLFFERISFVIILAAMAHRSENSRRLWLFPGSVRSFGKVPGKSLEQLSRIAKCYKFYGFRAPGKANLPRTLGRHCPDLVPAFRAGCVFFEIDSSSLLELF